MRNRLELQKHARNTRTLILLCIGCLAGVVGCTAQSEHPPAAPLSAEGDVAAPLDPPPDFTTTPAAVEQPTAAEENARAKPDNPRVAKFAERDTDQDGLLSLSEFSAGRTPQEAAKWFELRDADRDGYVSLAEFAPRSAPLAGEQRKAKRRGSDPSTVKSPDP